MKITKRQLRRIIKESMEDFGQKFDKAYKKPDGSYSGQPDEFGGSMMDLDDHNNLTSQIEKTIGQFVKMGYTREDVLYALQGILEEA